MTVDMRKILDSIKESFAYPPTDYPSDQQFPIKNTEIYQDNDPLGQGKWFWYKTVNGHISEQGNESYWTEEEARQAASGLTEEESNQVVFPESFFDIDPEDEHLLIAWQINDGQDHGYTPYPWKLFTNETASNHDYKKIAIDVAKGNSSGKTSQWGRWMIKPINIFQSSPDQENEFTKWKLITGQRDTDADLREAMAHWGGDFDIGYAPASWANYLLNHISIGLTPKQIDAANAWIKKNGGGQVIDILDRLDRGLENVRYAITKKPLGLE